MKRILCFMFCVTTLLMSLLTACNNPDNDNENKNEDTPKWLEDGTLKILCIGNSFSTDTMQWMPQIAKDLGIKNIFLGNLYISGCSLETHVKHALEENAAYDFRTTTDGTWSSTKEYRLNDAIAEYEWDFISFQQASHESGMPDTYDDLNTLTRIVSTLCPGAELVWNMTWAYQSNSTHASFPLYNSNQMFMYNAIVSAVQEKISPITDIKYIVPNGTAIQNARTSHLGDNLTRDGYHLTTDIGRYIAGVTFLHTVLDIDVSNLKFAPNNMSNNIRTIALESAINAVKTPFSVTPSQYSELENVLGDSVTTQKNLTFRMLVCYNSTNGGGHHYEPTGGSVAKKFCCTEKFTREQLPVGSVIEIAEGWSYRPEGWINGAQNTADTRPALTTTNIVIVDEDWWGNFTERAFNICRTDNAVLTNYTSADISQIFKIYLPENTAN